MRFTPLGSPWTGLKLLLEHGAHRGMGGPAAVRGGRWVPGVVQAGGYQGGLYRVLPLHPPGIALAGLIGIARAQPMPDVRILRPPGTPGTLQAPSAHPAPRTQMGAPAGQ